MSRRKIKIDRTKLSETVEKFLAWQAQDENPIIMGMELIRDYFLFDTITLAATSNRPDIFNFFLCSPENSVTENDVREVITGHKPSDPVKRTICPSKPSDILVCSYLYPTKTPERHHHVGIWNRDPIDLNEAEWLFLDMACQFFSQSLKFETTQISDAAILIMEAMNSVDDGIVLYDKDQKVVVANDRQKEIFPSVADKLVPGASYDEILRQQLKSGRLDLSEDKHADWIAQRKKNLSNDRYQEEQKFVDGRTIRLTNYQTPSGGSISIRNDITELVAARQQAVENEQLFRALLIGAPIPLMIITGTETVYVNSFAEKLFDANEGELHGYDVRNLYEDDARRIELLGKIDLTGILTDEELVIRSMSGTIKTTMISASTITYQNRRSYFVSLNEITDLVLTQQALQLSEQQNRAMLEMLPDALIVQVDGEVKYINQSAVEIFRAGSKENMMSKSSIELAAVQERDRILKIRNNRLHKDGSDKILSRHLRLDGEEFSTELFTQSVIWNNQEGTLSIVRDIEQQKSFERQLLRNEKEMNLAQSTGGFGHWRLDVKTGELIWSDQLYHLHLLDPATTKINIEMARSFIVPEDREASKAVIMNIIATGESTDHNISVVRADGEIRDLEGKILTEVNADGDVISLFGVIQDVTERKELEERLRQSQKMEAVGQLTGGIAHDFNNLLAVIQGNTELLMEMLDPQDEMKQSRLKIILGASERGADLTRSMLAFGRTQALNPTRTKLNDHVQTMVRVLDRTIEENIDIKSELVEDLWESVVDARQVENAILNLALNARDAMPDGGSIVFKTANISLKEARKLDFEDTQDREYVRLTVTDTGTGIAAGKLDHVFEPFFTTKEVGKGTGLGLSMVYGFIKQSEGQVALSSIEGRGTTVSLYLPRAIQENTTA